MQEDRCGAADANRSHLRVAPRRFWKSLRRKGDGGRWRRYPLEAVASPDSESVKKWHKTDESDGEEMADELGRHEMKQKRNGRPCRKMRREADWLPGLGGGDAPARPRFSAGGTAGEGGEWLRLRPGDGEKDRVMPRSARRFSISRARI